VNDRKERPDRWAARPHRGGRRPGRRPGDLRAGPDPRPNAVGHFAGSGSALCPGGGTAPHRGTAERTRATRQHFRDEREAVPRRRSANARSDESLPWSSWSPPTWGPGRAGAPGAWAVPSAGSIVFPRLPGESFSRTEDRRAAGRQPITWWRWRQHSREYPDSADDLCGPWGDGAAGPAASQFPVRMVGQPISSGDEDGFESGPVGSRGSPGLH